VVERGLNLSLQANEKASSDTREPTNEKDASTDAPASTDANKKLPIDAQQVPGANIPPS
jgi:hypothetical protein